MKYLLASAGLAVALTAQADATYVLYYGVIGDWTVLCGRDEVTKATSCDLSAPPPTLDVGMSRNVIVVRELAPESFEISIAVRDVVDPEQPASLWVDSAPPHEASIHQGSARWQGGEAASILTEMQAGSSLFYRVHLAPDGRPRDMEVPLSSFTRALTTYRDVARTHRVVE
ncbi:MAG: hypothetical protein ACE5Q3_07520 [Alphaproteobacteria bacterium]